MAADLELSAAQSKALRDIEDLLPMYVDPDEASRRMYWIVVEQRVAVAVRLSCTNEEICNSLAICRGLKAL